MSTNKTVARVLCAMFLPLALYSGFNRHGVEFAAFSFFFVLFGFAERQIDKDDTNPPTYATN